MLLHTYLTHTCYWLNLQQRVRLAGPRLPPFHLRIGSHAFFRPYLRLAQRGQAALGLNCGHFFLAFFAMRRVASHKLTAIVCELLNIFSPDGLGVHLSSQIGQAQNVEIALIGQTDQSVFLVVGIRIA